MEVAFRWREVMQVGRVWGIGKGCSVPVWEEWKVGLETGCDSS